LVLALFSKLIPSKCRWPIVRESSRAHWRGSSAPWRLCGDAHASSIL